MDTADHTAQPEPTHDLEPELGVQAALKPALDINDDDDPALACLSPIQREALRVLATNGRYRDAAKAAGVPVVTVWHWARVRGPFKAALAAPARIHDVRLDALESALTAGTGDDITSADRSVAVAAAKVLGTGTALGITPQDVDAASRARLGLAVSVSVDIRGLLATRDGPVLDAPEPQSARLLGATRHPTWEVDQGATAVPPMRDSSGEAEPAARRPGDAAAAPPTVLATQPRRSRSSSRRRAKPTP